VKSTLLRKSILALFLAVGICSVPNAVHADEDECSREILLSYFPSVFVKETLAKYKVPQDQWDAITKELADRDKNILKIVEEKAAKLESNPLKDPQQRQAAVKIFRDTLFENFAAVLKAHGVKDDKQIQEMLDNVQQQKAQRFAKCMQKHQQQQKANVKPPQAAQNKSEVEGD